MAKRPRHARGSERGGKWWRTLLAGSARVVCQEMLTSMRVSHFHHSEPSYSWQLTTGIWSTISQAISASISDACNRVGGVSLSARALLALCEECSPDASNNRAFYLQAMLGLPAQHRPRTRVAEAAVDGRVEVEDLRPRGQPLQGYLQRRAYPERAVCAQKTPQDTPQNSASTRCSCCTL